jgi:hypothetical protein
MRGKTTITITTVNGSKSYTIDQMIKSILSYVGLLIGAVFAIGALAIYFLLGEMDNYQTLKSQHKNLLMTNSDLEIEIREKQLELSDVSDKVADIEAMIGMSPGELPSVSARLDLARVSASERMLMLRSIPSGMPTEFRGFSSPFGWRNHPLRRQREFHTGLDFRGPIGTPIYAAADGVVELVRPNRTVGFGNLITLSHSYGFKTLYAHLSRMIVTQGSFVQKGQLIGYLGNTGYSTGPHLHYEVRYLNRPLDPMSFVEWDLESYGSIFEKEKKVQWDSVIKGIKWQWTLLEQLSSQREQSSLESLTSSANSTSTGR